MTSHIYGLPNMFGRNWKFGVDPNTLPKTEPGKWGHQKRVSTNQIFGTVSETDFYSADLQATSNRLSRNTFFRTVPKKTFLLVGFVSRFIKPQVRDLQNGQSWGFWENRETVDEIPLSSRNSPPFPNQISRRREHPRL
jgi:hypothetical protein